MMDFEIALAILSAVVLGVFVFGALWIRIERRQSAGQLFRHTPPGQQSIHFPEERDLVKMVRER